jgi:hypothetical protein
VDQALGKDSLSLPASINGANGPTTTPMEAADLMNKYFIDKVDDLQKKALLPRETPYDLQEAPDDLQETPDDPQDAPNVSQEVDDVTQEVDDDLQEADNDTMSNSHVHPSFHFKFANAKTTSEAIKGLNNIEALGTDCIPTSVLKKGVEVLAGPISHLVNRSLAKGRVPKAFKIGLVHPIHKGKGKPREDPGSYRPVSILPAMSKVLETIVKGDLEEHLKRVNGLYGVRQGSILGPLLFIILTSGMADFLGVREDETIVYADDSNVWQTGSNVEEVARKLAEKATLFVEYTIKMGLSMNAAKTQLLFLSRAGNVTNTTVEVDGSIIHPGDAIELLGIKYDRRLTSGPHVKALLAAVRQRASVISRLANHLPRGEYLRQLAYGLVIGKLLHALAAVARPRLEQEDKAAVVWSRIQVALNDVARSITGTRRRDHIRIEDLLSKAGLKSTNRMVVKAIAAEIWGCFHSDDERDGARNHVRKLLFLGKRTSIAKTTRSATNGQIKVPLRGGDTFITHAAHVWNKSATLRQATTKAKAKKAASDLAGLLPL